MKKLLKRFLQAAAFGFLFLTMLIVGFYNYENHRGRDAWREYEAEAKARGVKLNLEDFIPPPVPESENFAALPIFYAGGNPFQFPAPPSVSAYRAKKLPPEDLLDLRKQRDAFVKAKWIDAASDEPARDILRALERFEPELQTIRDAVDRPHTQFRVDASEEPIAKRPQMTAAMGAGMVLALRTRAHLAVGESEKAFSEFIVGKRLAEAMEGDPTLLSTLAAMAIWNGLADAVQAGLLGRNWNEPELGRLVTTLQDKGLIEAWRFGLKTERAQTNHLFEWIADLRAGRKNLTDDTGLRIATIPSLYPSGWIALNRVKLNQYYDSAIARVEANGGTFSLGKSEKNHEQYRLEPSIFVRLQNMFLIMLLPMTESLEKRVLRAHTRIQQAYAGCILEQYRNRHGAFPDDVATAFDEIDAKVPMDVGDGESLRYEKTDDGYQLWSVAKDRVDEFNRNKTWGEIQNWIWEIK